MALDSECHRFCCIFTNLRYCITHLSNITACYCRPCFHISLKVTKIPNKAGPACCALSFSPCVCGDPANTGVWSHLLRSRLATVVRGNPCLAFQTASSDDCICVSSSLLSDFFLFFSGDGRQLETSRTARSVHHLWSPSLSPASSARANTHTQKYTHAQTKDGQPASVCSVWRPFIQLMAKHYFSGYSSPFKGSQSISASSVVNLITTFTTLLDAVWFLTHIVHEKVVLNLWVMTQKRNCLAKKQLNANNTIQIYNCA